MNGTPAIPFPSGNYMSRLLHTVIQTITLLVEPYICAQYLLWSKGAAWHENGKTEISGICDFSFFLSVKLQLVKLNWVKTSVFCVIGTVCSCC